MMHPGNRFRMEWNHSSVRRDCIRMTWQNDDVLCTVVKKPSCCRSYLKASTSVGVPCCPIAYHSALTVGDSLLRRLWFYCTLSAQSQLWLCFIVASIFRFARFWRLSFESLNLAMHQWVKILRAACFIIIARGASQARSKFEIYQNGSFISFLGDQSSYPFNPDKCFPNVQDSLSNSKPSRTPSKLVWIWSRWSPKSDSSSPISSVQAPAIFKKINSGNVVKAFSKKIFRPFLLPHLDWAVFDLTKVLAIFLRLAGSA